MNIEISRVDGETLLTVFVEDSKEPVCRAFTNDEDAFKAIGILIDIYFKIPSTLGKVTIEEAEEITPF